MNPNFSQRTRTAAIRESFSSSTPNTTPNTNTNTNTNQESEILDLHQTIEETPLMTFHREIETNFSYFPKPPTPLHPTQIPGWRIKERMKTVSCLLCLCLNIGVDPPDMIKPQPCAQLIGWQNPSQLPNGKQLEIIGKQIQSQFEQFQPRARYKQLLDPTAEELKKSSMGLRRSSKDERICVYYNGHGVPKPTRNHELWVFNKTFTQYIPISVYDFQQWIGMPSIWIYDCHHASLLLVDEKEGLIQLAACGENEELPLNPDLPADLFTSCLTTPIETSLRLYLLQNPLLKLDSSIIEKVPGRLNDRRTPLGELNWIFTAITDTIAFTSLPREQFKQLYRQDLLVAALYRNYLLADRLMRGFGVCPVSRPEMKTMRWHWMWECWDLVLDECLSQMPQILKDPSVEYRHSLFFTEQLSAFELCLNNTPTTNSKSDIPTQLPIVLQVLLSQTHRLRALVLLGKYLDQSRQAVEYALAVGIFPYILKLLQSPALELRLILVFIWARILAVDWKCRVDLLKDGGFMYFINILKQGVSTSSSAGGSSSGGRSSDSSDSEMKAMCCFVLSVLSDDQEGQLVCMKAGLLEYCLHYINDSDPLLRQWSMICMAKLLNGSADGKWFMMQSNRVNSLFGLLTDSVVEVRIACLYLFGSFLSIGDPVDQQLEYKIWTHLLDVLKDGSSVVRQEFLYLLGKYIQRRLDQFVNASFEYLNDERQRQSFFYSSSSTGSSSRGDVLVGCLWKVLLNRTVDPVGAVAQHAQEMVDYVNLEMLRHYPDMIFTLTSTTTTTTTKSLTVSSGARLQKLLSSTGSTLSPIQSPHLSTKTLKRNQSLSKSFKSLNIDLPTTTTTTTTKQTIPQLKTESDYYQNSFQFFLNPRLKTNDTADPGGPQYLKKSFKIKQIEQEIHCARLAQISQDYVLERELQLIDHHSLYLNHLDFGMDLLVAVNDSQSIMIYEWKKQMKKISEFKIQSECRSRITGLRLVNDLCDPLLLLTSDDGCCRVYGDLSEQPELHTGWKLMPELVPDETGAGLVVEWHQSTGTLYASGDVPLIRIFDAESELSKRDIQTLRKSSVTHLHCDSYSGNLLISSHSDGHISLYDQRHQNPMVMGLEGHSDWLLGTYFQKSPGRKLISASMDGILNYWDLRYPQKPYHSLNTDPLGQLSCFAIHQDINLFAIGSTSQYIKVYSDQELKQTIRYHEGFLGQRIAPVQCLGFHRHFLLLAAGGMDQYLSVWGPKSFIMPS